MDSTWKNNGENLTLFISPGGNGQSFCIRGITLTQDCASLSPLPSNNPSISPSASPSEYPSIAPSNAPSSSPTGAPILLCDQLTLIINSTQNNTDYDVYFEGIFRRQDDDDLINDKYWWQQQENEGSKLFYSDDTWMLQSTDINSYWLLSEYNQYIDNIQPPLYDEWQYYTNSPINQDTANLTFD